MNEQISKKLLSTIVVAVLASMLVLVALCSCAPKEIDINDVSSIEDAVGKATSIPIDINKKYAAATPTEKGQSENMIITVSGLKGGNAETYVDEGCASASEIMIKYFNQLTDNKIHFRIAGIKCGEKETLIPTSFTLTLNINKKHEAEAKQIFNDLSNNVKNDYPNDNAWTSQVSVEQASGEFPSQQDTEKIVNALNAIPYGIVEMNKTYKNIIKTNGNIGIIELNGGQLHISALLRSTDSKSLKDKANEISENLKSSKIDWAAPENIG